MAAALTALATASRVGEEPTAPSTGVLTRAHPHHHHHHHHHYRHRRHHHHHHHFQVSSRLLRQRGVRQRSSRRLEVRVFFLELYLYLYSLYLYLFIFIWRCECEAGWRSPAHPAHQDCSLPQELVCGDGQDNDQGLNFIF